MISQLIGAVTNIILDPIFIFGLFGMPRMEVAGAAIATVLGQSLAMLFLFYVLARKEKVLKINLKGFRFHGGMAAGTAGLFMGVSPGRHCGWCCHLPAAGPFVLAGSAPHRIFAGRAWPRILVVCRPGACAKLLFADYPYAAPRGRRWAVIRPINLWRFADASRLYWQHCRNRYFPPGLSPFGGQYSHARPQ